ncbi:MAG: Asp23/Gls24 family envelope stress response protein [Clostridia bacterium]
MEVYAFIGKTGTGKSYNAQMVAYKYGIKYIIDDAILIKDNKVITGMSAKTCNTKIASVKSAIFLNKDSRKEMINAIKIEKIDKILILGTSDEMLDKIVENLELGNIYKKIYIEDIIDKDAIEYARSIRINEGKHVIPVPTFEIKEQFSGYFLDPLKIFNSIFNNDTHMMEKTIIRPTFSYLGKFNISDKVINNIIEYVSNKVYGITKVYKITVNKYVDGMKIDIDIEVMFGLSIPNIANDLKIKVIKELDRATGINIFGININVKGVKK